VQKSHLGITICWAIRQARYAGVLADAIRADKVADESNLPAPNPVPIDPYAVSPHANFHARPTR